MNKISWSIKLLLILVTVMFSSNVLNTSKAYATPLTAADVPADCDVNLMNAMRTKGIAKAQQETVVAQYTITKPDKTRDLTCYEQQLRDAAAEVMGIFSANPAFGGCPSDVFLRIANTLQSLYTAHQMVANLGGGTIEGSAAARNEKMLAVIIGMMASQVTGAMTAALGGWIADLFGGGCLATTIGNAVTQIANAVADALVDFGCDNMKKLWGGVALKKVDGSLFRTARQLAREEYNGPIRVYPPEAIGGEDIEQAVVNVENLVAATLTNVVLDHIREGMDGTGIFEDALDIDLQDIIDRGAFAPHRHSERLLPYDPVTNPTCRAIPTFGPYVSCTRGCEMTGTFPSYTCTPSTP